MIQATTDPPHRRTAAPIAAALLTAILYAVSLRGSFVYDDAWVVAQDPRLHDIRLWPTYLTESYNNGIDNLYRPLTSLTFAAQWQWGAGRPWLFHAVNLLLAAADAALVAILAARLARWAAPASANPAAWIAGLLFAAHPLHVEAIAYISGRPELLSALGALGAIILFCRRPLTIGRALAVCACCTLSALSKEQGLLLPAVLVILAYCSKLTAASVPVAAVIDTRSAGVLLYAPPKLVVSKSRIDRLIDFLTPGREQPSASERRAMVVLLLFICWAMAVYIRFRDAHLKFYWDRAFLDWSIQPMIRSVGIDRLLMPLVLIGRYTALFLLPLKLSPDYGGAVIGWHVRPGDPYLYLGIAAVLIWCVAFGSSLRRRRGALLFCLITLAIFYGVIGNIVTLIGTNFGERLAYLPSAFVILAVSLPAARCLAGASRAARRATYVALGIAVILLSARSVTYAARWNDPLSFYEWAAAEQPKSVRLHMLVASDYYNRGLKLIEAGHLDQARPEFDHAAAAAELGRKSLPDYYEIYVQLAEIEINRNNFDAAQHDLDVAMKLQPSEKVQAWMTELAKHRAATQKSSS